MLDGTRNVSEKMGGPNRPARRSSVWGAGPFLLGSASRRHSRAKSLADARSFVTAPEAKTQKYSLSANCISRGEFLTPVITPKVTGFATLAPGNA